MLTLQALSRMSVGSNEMLFYLLRESSRLQVLVEFEAEV